MLHAGIFLNANFFYLPMGKNNIFDSGFALENEVFSFIYKEKEDQEHLGKLSFFLSPAVRW